MSTEDPGTPQDTPAAPVWPAANQATPPPAPQEPPGQPAPDPASGPAPGQPSPSGADPGQPAQAPPGAYGSPPPGYGPPPPGYGPPSPYGQQPGYNPYGAGPYGAPAGQYGAPGRKTNGLAVVSLVLSIIWLGGLGAVLAVVLGFLARGAIKKSQGTQTGEGLALVGIIIGFIGILGAALLWGAVIVGGSAIHSIVTPHNANVGQSMSVSPVTDGINRVTVFSLNQAVTPESPDVQADRGNQFDVADVQMCASASGSSLSDSFIFWDLKLADGTEEPWSSQIVKAPDLSDSSTIPPNGCVRGFVSFEVPAGSTPQQVIFRPSVIQTYQWTVR